LNIPKSYSFASGADVILPFPSLDAQAGKSLPIFDSIDLITVDEARFNGQFGYVISTQKSVRSSSILFLVLMIVTALVFLGLLFFYVSVLRKEEDIVDSHEAIINHLLKKE
jgi:hypothetical protein